MSTNADEGPQRRNTQSNAAAKDFPPNVPSRSPNPVRPSHVAPPRPVSQTARFIEVARVSIII